MDFALTTREQKLRYDTPWKAIFYFCLPPILIIVTEGLYNIIDKSLSINFAASDMVNWSYYIKMYYEMTGATSIPLDQMQKFINIATQYASQTYNLLFAFVVMLGIGCALNFSIAFGKRDRKAMAQIAGNGFVFTTLISIVIAFFVFLLVFPGLNSVFITSQMGSKFNPITQQLAWEYTFPMLLAAPLMFLTYYFISLIRSEGRMYWSIFVTLGSVVVNCGAALFFMRVCHLGITGAMLGTVFSWATQVLCGFIIVFKFKNSYSRFNFKDVVNLKLTNLKNFTKVGFPNFLANVSIVVVSFISTSIVVGLPGQTDSTNNISILQELASSITPWMTLIVSAGIGISQGSRTILAYNYGAQKYNRIWQILKRSSILLIGWFTLSLVVFIIFGKYMMMWFAFPADQADKYRWWLVLNFMTYPLCSISFISLTLFQGINRSALSTFSNSLRSFIIILPLIGIGYGVSHATGNPIFYYVFVGLNDLISAAILLPILINFWRKYKNQLIDKISQVDIDYQANLNKTLIVNEEKTT